MPAGSFRLPPDYATHLGPQPTRLVLPHEYLDLEEKLLRGGIEHILATQRDNASTAASVPMSSCANLAVPGAGGAFQLRAIAAPPAPSGRAHAHDQVDGLL